MMKKLFLGALVLLLAACSTKIDEGTTLTPEGRTFHGIIAEEESRVFLDDQIRLHWNAGDLITLFEGITRNKKYKFMGEDGDNAGDFEFVSQGFGTGNDLDRYYAVYPYASTTKYVYGTPDYIQYTLPATQTYVAGSVGKDANVMVAITADLDDFDLRFRNACSFLLIRLWGAEGQTVGSITLSSLGGEPLAGKCQLVPTYGGTPTLTMTGTATSITLSCSEGVAIGTSEAEATDFWLVLPPATYAGGISVKVAGYYGGEQTFTVDKSLTFERNKYKRLMRELTIPSSDTNMGVDGWGDGSENEGTAE